MMISAQSDHSLLVGYYAWTQLLCTSTKIVDKHFIVVYTFNATFYAQLSQKISDPFRI